MLIPSLMTHTAPRVLIAESHAETLLQCAEAVQGDAQLSLAAAVSTGAAAIAMMDQCTPDVVVVDLLLQDMPAVQVIRHVAWHFPQADIVVLAQFGDDEQVLQCIEAGATAYLFKDSAAECLAQSIHLWREGSAPISPGMARRVLGRFHLRLGTGTGSAWAFPLRESTHPLSACEAGILRWIARGMSLEQVGALAAHPQQGVLAHVKKIYRKLAAHARGESLADTDASDIQIVALGSASNRRAQALPSPRFSFFK
ncbi:response regulator [Rhodoferax sp. WC2427]|uniref:response regulator n=1 Tax=Rhodoferax sp. WC2427 TaxID=3234144 RepID=UPI003465D487